jgi:hypothetical protein
MCTYPPARTHFCVALRVRMRADLPQPSGCRPRLYALGLVGTFLYMVWGWGEMNRMSMSMSMMLRNWKTGCFLGVMKEQKEEGGLFRDGAYSAQRWKRRVM